MPQDPAYQELEADITEKYGGGRNPQEFAKSGGEGGSKISHHPGGIHPSYMRKKILSTIKKIGRPFTARGGIER